MSIDKQQEGGRGRFRGLPLERWIISIIVWALVVALPILFFVALLAFEVGIGIRWIKELFELGYHFFGLL